MDANSAQVVEAQKRSEHFFAYIGTYTGARSKGIYCSRFDAAKGTFTQPELAAEVKNPSFLAVQPQGWLYAVAEIGDFAGGRSGAVSAFQADRSTGKLTLLNQQPSGGSGPCHLALDRTGKCVLVANYGSGSVAVLPVAPDGKLLSPSCTIQHRGSSVNKQRQEGPHAHFIIPDLANRFALACDLGLDKVLVYRLHAAAGNLVPNEPPAIDIQPGSGPRHLVFDRNQRFVYVLNEMGCSVTVLEFDPISGRGSAIQTVPTLPGNFKGNSSCAEIQAHPSGKTIYASNRGHDSIAVYSVDPKSGKLALVQHELTGGKTPRHFTLDPTGRWLIAENQDSHNIVVFKVSPEDGRLTPTGHRIEVGSPVSLEFLRAR